MIEEDKPVFNPDYCTCPKEFMVLTHPCEYCFYFPDPVPEKEEEDHRGL